MLKTVRGKIIAALLVLFIIGSIYSILTDVRIYLEPLEITSHIVSLLPAIAIPLSFSKKKVASGILIGFLAVSSMIQFILDAASDLSMFGVYSMLCAGMYILFMIGTLAGNRARKPCFIISCVLIIGMSLYEVMLFRIIASVHIEVALYFIPSLLLDLLPFIAIVIALSIRNGEAPEKESAYQEIYSDSIAKLVILTFVTLGIYGLIWKYRLMRNVRILSFEETNCTGEFLLFLFVPFYSLYWYATRGSRISESARMQGRTIENKGVMYLLLALFGFPIIADCIMQSDFNKLATGTGSAAFPRVDDVALTLERYARMCDRGVITQEQFQRKKAEFFGK